VPAVHRKTARSDRARHGYHLHKPDPWASASQSPPRSTLFYYCLIGCLLGTLIGVLPGIGPVATIAMLLPITF